MNMDLSKNSLTVLVSGATGFIGPHVTKYFREKGVRVVGISKRPHPDTISGDITDANFVETAFRRNRPDIYIHLSGVGTAQLAEKDFSAAQKITIVGTATALEACRMYTPKLIIFGSTSQVYGDSIGRLNEESHVKPKGKFETIKWEADRLAQSYGRLFNLPIVIARFVNVYGPGDIYYSRVIPSIIRSVVLDKKVELWGNGNNIREYLYIDDVIKAIEGICISAAEHTLSGVFNFGSGEPVTVNKLAQTIIDLMGEKTPLVHSGSALRETPGRIVVESTKARKILGWTPKHTLRQGLIETIPWYLGHLLRYRV